jgi:tryptophan-rich sensory protein
MSERLKKILSYIVSILIPLAIGTLSALITMGNMDIYEEIVTPPLSPPGWLFPVVWSVLYTLMGISAGMVWQKRKEKPKEVDKAISYYALSLAFNFVWSILFFNFKLYLVSFAWLIILFVLIVYTIRAYLKISKISAYLQIPYAVWVAFAGYLNLAIWFLNR